MSTSITVLADDGTFGAFVITPETADGTIEGYNFDGTFMLGIYGGNKKKFSDNLGYYGGLDMSINTIDETETSDNAIYSYSNINMGVTYSLTNEFSLIGGVGISIQSGQFVYYGSDYETKENKTRLNLQAGVIYDITDKFGALLKYDTASSSIGGGITFNF